MNDVLVMRRIPGAEGGFRVEGEGDALGLPGGEEEAREGDQLELGLAFLRLRAAVIELRDFVAGALASVFDGEREFGTVELGVGQLREQRQRKWLPTGSASDDH